jgi:hypothetical protein
MATHRFVLLVPLLVLFLLVLPRFLQRRHSHPRGGQFLHNQKMSEKIITQIVQAGVSGRPTQKRGGGGWVGLVHGQNRGVRNTRILDPVHDLLLTFPQLARGKARGGERKKMIDRIRRREIIYCKRAILSLSSSKILTPNPSQARSGSETGSETFVSDPQH